MQFDDHLTKNKVIKIREDMFKCNHKLSDSEIEAGRNVYCNEWIDLFSEVCDPWLDKCG